MGLIFAFDPENDRIEIEFENCKALAVKYDRATRKATLLLQMEMPCKVCQRQNKIKNGKEVSEIIETKSIFNLEKQEEFPFLNYWNLDQSFLIEGLASREGIDNLVSLLRLKNRYIEFCENATIDECAQEVSQALTQRSNTFRAIMNNQRFMQLRYSVIALLSQGHVCLFN